MHAQVAQTDHRLSGPLGLDHQAALGDFDVQQVRRNRVGHQERLDGVRQVRIVQVAHRQVHRDRNAEASGVPDTALADRRLEHPATQRRDQAGLLGERNEVVWHDQATPRVLPAHQGLDPCQARVGAVALGLVVEPQLVALDTLAQLTAERQTLGAVIVLLALVHGPAAAGPLGDVHRHVCPAQHRLGVAAVLGVQHHAQAPANVDAGALEFERLVQRLQEPRRHRPRTGLVDPGQQHRELVAADAGQGIRLAQNISGRGVRSGAGAHPQRDGRARR